MLRSAWHLIRAFVRFSGIGAARAAVLMLASGLTEGISLALFVPLIGLIAAPAGSHLHRAMALLCSHFGACDPDARIFIALGLMVIAIGARAWIMAKRDQVMARLQTAFVENERVQFVRTLAAARWQDLADLRHARVTYMLASEIPRLASAVQQVATTLMATVMLLGQLVLLALLAWPLALLFVVSGAIGLVASVPSLRRAGALAAKTKRDNLAIVDLAAQLLGGLKLAMAQNMQHAFVAEMEQTSGAIARRQAAYSARTGRARVLGTTAAALALAVMVVIGVRAHMPGTSLVVAMAVFARMLGPGTSILRSINQLAAVLPAHAALASLSRALGATEPAIPPQATAAGSTAETIRFDHVSYTHSGGGNPAEGSARLVDLDFTIAPGEIVGIVGASGAGKTTLVDLLCGLIAPQSGEIRVGATVLAGTALHRWRDGAAYIAQDCYLFNDTLRRNLCWGLAGIDDAAIAEALAIAEATEVVRSLAHGLEETVGERGIRLSGGERQRLAIARALLRRPVLIVLDEATNALDIATERRILGRLASLPHRPTLLIVAHRPEALEQCNRVLHLDAGRLTAQATAIQTP